ncbi:hypothetical protein GWG54_15825 [Natronococcus sp. JC468]|uniref:hypothetical protein n=1 Tax=Natronococcus sp. JC468 TaxID=1961921 RepID=UPI001438D187|nr:hypothetical protein [Natronococcus sp. JC468]NKE37261.1 hypothetical protein [Natronococcus sp. JC468]
MNARTTIASEFDVGDGPEAVTVRKLLTPRGQLVEIESDSETGETATQIRIDALGLESLSWQTVPNIVDRLDCDSSVRDKGEIASDSGESFEISNEYADVEVSKIRTPAGEQLLVRSLVKKTTLQLTPEMLSALSLHETKLVSEFLETPHGPHDH